MRIKLQSSALHGIKFKLQFRENGDKMEDTGWGSENCSLIDSNGGFFFILDFRFFFSLPR